MCNWFQNKSPTHTFAVDWDTWHGNWAAPCYFNGASPTGSARWGYCLQRHLACEGLYQIPPNRHTAHRPWENWPCPWTNSSNCRFSHQMKVIPVVSDIWSQSFYSTEASFQFNPKIYRGHGTMSPRKLRSEPKVDFQKVPVPWYRKVAPVLEFPFPAERSTLLAIVGCWMKVGVCVICHMEFRFGLHRTDSRKFYSTLNEGFDRWL